MLGYLPRSIINKSIIEPMRWGTAGTVLAAEKAENNGIAVNMSGGYHHASQQRGEGFCLFSDVGGCGIDIEGERTVKSRG